ncbi:MAG: hypothetical protein ACR2PY_05705, partial [Salinispira sp.]
MLQKLQSLGGTVLRSPPELISLTGMGQKRLAALKNAGIMNLPDLLLRVPRRYEDRRKPQGLHSLSENGRVFTRIQVLAIEYIYARGRRTPKILVADEEGSGYLVCFGRPFLVSRLVPGSRWLLAASFVQRRGELHAGSFEYYPERENEKFFRIHALYPSVPGIFPTVLHQFYT